jgi:hypothetical protein
VRASDLQISDGAQVEGNVIAQTVTVCGRVKGTIRADRVKLQNGGAVEGDIFHRSLSIDENSQFEGSSRRVENPTEPSSSVDTKGPQKKDMQSPASAPLPFIERSTLPVVPPDTSRSRHVAFEAKPENLIGDRAYDSDPPDEELRRDGIEMIAPDRANRSKPPTQDRRRLTRYMRRWLVERFLAWIQWQRWNSRPLGVLYPEFPGLCSTRLPRYPFHILRQVLSKN